MGKLEFFHILLDKIGSVFSPGETISGSVHIKTKERLKINGLKIQFKGSTYGINISFFKYSFK